jgi:hypothetical protein
MEQYEICSASPHPRALSGKGHRTDEEMEE